MTAAYIATTVWLFRLSNLYYNVAAESSALNHQTTMDIWKHTHTHTHTHTHIQFSAFLLKQNKKYYQSCKFYGTNGTNYPLHILTDVIIKHIKNLTYTYIYRNSQIRTANTDTFTHKHTRRKLKVFIFFFLLFFSFFFFFLFLLRNYKPSLTIVLQLTALLLLLLSGIICT